MYTLLTPYICFMFKIVDLLNIYVVYNLTDNITCLNETNKTIQYNSQIQCHIVNSIFNRRLVKLVQTNSKETKCYNVRVIKKHLWTRMFVFGKIFIISYVCCWVIVLILLTLLPFNPSLILLYHQKTSSQVAFTKLLPECMPKQTCHSNIHL